MGEPRLAILDEPTSGLDPLMIEAFAEAVHDLKRAGRTAVFLSSHVLSEVEKTCDRVAIVRDGRLMAVRTIAELGASLPRRVTIRFASNWRRSGSPPWGKLVLPPGAASCLPKTASAPTPVSASSPPTPAPGCSTSPARSARWSSGWQGLRVADIDVRAPSLEDYVLGLYRGES